MNKTLATLAAISALAASGLIYPATMKVVNVNNGVADLMTATGHLYQIEAEDYVPGDLVSLVMWSNGTEEITDDAIISHRYSGFICE